MVISGAGLTTVLQSQIQFFERVMITTKPDNAMICAFGVKVVQGMITGCVTTVVIKDTSLLTAKDGIMRQEDALTVKSEATLLEIARRIVPLQAIRARKRRQTTSLRKTPVRIFRLARQCRTVV